MDAKREIKEFLGNFEKKYRHKPDLLELSALIHMYIVDNEIMFYDRAFKNKEPKELESYLIELNNIRQENVKKEKKTPGIRLKFIG